MFAEALRHELSGTGRVADDRVPGRDRHVPARAREGPHARLVPRRPGGRPGERAGREGARRRRVRRPRRRAPAGRPAARRPAQHGPARLRRAAASPARAAPPRRAATDVASFEDAVAVLRAWVGDPVLVRLDPDGAVMRGRLQEADATGLDGAAFALADDDGRVTATGLAIALFRDAARVVDRGRGHLVVEQGRVRITRAPVPRRARRLGRRAGTPAARRPGAQDLGLAGQALPRQAQELARRRGARARRGAR